MWLRLARSLPGVRDSLASQTPALELGFQLLVADRAHPIALIQIVVGIALAHVVARAGRGGAIQQRVQLCAGEIQEAAADAHRETFTLPRSSVVGLAPDR